MSDRLLVIDEGTSSARAMLFDAGGNSLGPRPAYGRQPVPAARLGGAGCGGDLHATQPHALVDQAGGADRIAAIGITNQRETIVFWDRRSGRPLAPAIVWRDRRTASDCEALKQAGHEPAVQSATGLLLDPYFSASKIRWALDHWPQLADAGGNLAIGTVDSWLIFRLTGGLHVSDATNASRTALMGLSGGWDEGLLDLFGVPRKSLPEICDSAGQLGTTLADHFGGAIPICGVAGDQQAARSARPCRTATPRHLRYRHLCPDPCRPPPVSHHRLLGTVAWQLAGARRYALEGSLFVAGSMMQWLRDQLGLIGTVESEALASSVADSAGVAIVPASSSARRTGTQRRAAPSSASRSAPAAPTSSGLSRRSPTRRSSCSAPLPPTASAGRRSGLTAACPPTASSPRTWPMCWRWRSNGRPISKPPPSAQRCWRDLGAGLFASLDEAASAVRGEVTTFEPDMGTDTRSSRLAASGQGRCRRPRPQLSRSASSIPPKRSVSRSSR